MIETADYTARQQNRFGVWLWILLGFFCFRVSAQLIQANAPVAFLPPFEAWQSGLLPYWMLVLGQVLIIAFYGRTAWAFSSVRIHARWRTGRTLTILGGIYALSMVIRYIIRMSLFEQERWAGGCLPIFFHLILASFLLIWGTYHLRYGRREQKARARASEPAYV